MNNSNTSDQEISAVQGLLALRHSKPTSDYLLTSAFQLASPPLTQTLNSNKQSPSSTYSTPIDSDTSDRLVEGINTMSTLDQTPASSLDSSPNLVYYNSQVQFVRQAQQAPYVHHQAQYSHHHAQYAHHQAQIVRQSHHNRCFYQPQPQPPKQQQQQCVLPSIQEMMAGHPLSSHTKAATNVITTNYNGGGHSRYSRAAPHHPYSRKYTTVSLDRLEKHNSTILEARKQKIEQHQQYQQHQLAENQLRQQHMLYHNQQLETKMLLQSHENHRLLANLQNHSESELQSFFQSLRQYYREEYEKEQQDKKAAKNAQQQGNNETDDDDSSDHQPSNNTPSSSTISSMIASKKSNNNNKKRSNGGVDKPRWTAQEKAELFEAIVKHKSLDIMATFDWGVIGEDIGRVDKACKDQWRRGILKMFRDFIHNL